MAGIPLTLTCGDYEITRLLAEGAVTADGIDLTVLTDIASRDRHWRLARNGECDAGEFNAFGYFMASAAILSSPCPCFRIGVSATASCS